MSTELDELTRVSDQGCAIIFWTLAEFITICVRTRRSGLRLTGIPPGAHVAADLLLWIVTVVFLGIITASFISTLQSSSYPSITSSQIGINVAILAFQTTLMSVLLSMFSFYVDS